MNLTKQQKLDILSKAIDEGASINVYYHKLDKQEDAQAVINKLGEIAGLPTVHDKYECHKWYKIKTRGFHVAAFYDRKPIAK